MGSYGLLELHCPGALGMKLAVRRGLLVGERRRSGPQLLPHHDHLFARTRGIVASNRKLISCNGELGHVVLKLTLRYPRHRLRTSRLSASFTHCCVLRFSERICLRERGVLAGPGVLRELQRRCLPRVQEPSLL